MAKYKSKPATPATQLLNPSMALLVKLGSIAVHAEELNSPDGHHFDKTALEQLFNDAEVKDWLAQMTKLGMLPVKRKSD